MYLRFDGVKTQWRSRICFPTALLFVILTNSVASADRIVLRNFKVLNNVTVTAFDEDGANVTDNGVISWDQIERGTVAASKQADFDRLKTEIGVPLYRIRQRLSVGDYASLAEEAEKLLPRFRGRTSETAYLVLQALMWGRLADNRREEAVEAYLLCFEQLRNNRRYQNQIVGTRKLSYDPATGMTPEILPLFFNKEAAKKALPNIQAVAQSMKQPIPQAAMIYYVSVALAAEDVAAADKLLKNIKPTPALTGQWKTLSEAQKHLLAKEYSAAETLLSSEISQMQAFNKPAASYLLGSARVLGNDAYLVERGVLDLVMVPALETETHPELAAASLYRTMQAFQRLKQDDNRAIIRKELLSNFTGTYYGNLLHQQLTTSDN